MSTIVVAAILIVSAILISSLFIYINRKNALKRNDLLLTLFKEAGMQHGLSFSSQEVLKNKIIGFDGLNQTLLIFEFAPERNTFCIEMSEVKSCSITKEFESVSISTDKKARAENYLSSIDIKFHLLNSLEPVSISFYDNTYYSIFEMKEMEAKAKHWVALLAKMTVKACRAPA